MKKYKLLRDWTSFKANDIVELDEETAKALMIAETVVEYDEAAEKALKVSEDAKNASIKSAVQEAVSKALSNVEGTDMRLHVEVTREEADKGFESLGEQIQAVKAFSKTGVRDDRFEAVARKAASGMSETIDEDGGFLVDPDISKDLVSRMYDTGILVSRTQTVEVSGNGLVWREVQDYNRVAGSHAVQVYWTEEAGDKTKSAPKFNEREMRLRKLAGLVYLTDELIEDAPAITSFVGNAFVNEFGFALDSAVMNGTGAGMPLGYRLSDAMVTVAKEGSQTQDTIVEKNVTKMYSRMPARSVASAIWLVSNTAWTQLPGMTVGEQPVFLNPSGDIKEAPGGFLYGRPVVQSEHCEVLGDLGDIQFVNLNDYITIRKGMLKTDTSIHVRFVQDETALRLVLRVNGQPLQSSKITPAKGTAYESSFVQLAERS